MPRRRKNMAHNSYKYYNDGKRDIRVGGRDIRHGGRDMRDEGRDLRRGGRDLRDIGRDLRGSDIKDGRDISDGGREKGYTVQDFPPPSNFFCFFVRVTISVKLKLLIAKVLLQDPLHNICSTFATN